MPTTLIHRDTRTHTHKPTKRTSLFFIIFLLSSLFSSPPLVPIHHWCSFEIVNGQNPTHPHTDTHLHKTYFSILNGNCNYCMSSIMNIQMGCSRFLGSQGFPTWERDMTIFWCPFLLIKMELHQYIYLIYTCSIYTERWVIEIFKIFEKPHHNNWSTSQVCLGATLSWTGAYSCKHVIKIITNYSQLFPATLFCFVLSSLQWSSNQS